MCEFNTPLLLCPHLRVLCVVRPSVSRPSNHASSPRATLKSAATPSRFLLPMQGLMLVLLALAVSELSSPADSAPAALQDLDSDDSEAFDGGSTFPNAMDSEDTSSGWRSPVPLLPLGLLLCCVPAAVSLLAFLSRPTGLAAAHRSLQLCIPVLVVPMLLSVQPSVQVAAAVLAVACAAAAWYASELHRRSLKVL